MNRIVCSTMCGEEHCNMLITGIKLVVVYNTIMRVVYIYCCKLVTTFEMYRIM